MVGMKNVIYVTFNTFWKSVKCYNYIKEPERLMSWVITKKKQNFNIQWNFN